MAHTLFEQTLDLSKSETPADDIHNLFAEQFGYTQNGSYYFSPVDASFGIRWEFSSYTYCYVTFDGGISETEFLKLRADTTPKVNKICYHVSKNEKVIYLRVYYYIFDTSAESMMNGVDVIIAYDEKGKTTCFRGHTWSGSSSYSYRIAYMLNSKKLLTKIYYCKDPIKDSSTASLYNCKISPNMPNAIYRYPSLEGYCAFSELYGVVNVQSFPSLGYTFVQFGNDIYRIVGCFDNCSAFETYGMPYFAFPVSD